MSMQPTSAPSSPRAARAAFPALTALVLGVALWGTGCGPKYPSCEEDGDCKAAEFCVQGTCQKCRTDNDCSTGQSCNGGQCANIPDYCDERVTCGGGKDCVGNRCQDPQPEPLVREQPVSTGCQLQTVYFAFDSSNLEPSARDVIAKNAQCVREKSMPGVRITGYTDNRGTEEYNLALGDRRARSVEQYMGSLGIEKGKLSSSSMGEELARGDDESGMAQDRKVEFTGR